MKRPRRYGVLGVVIVACIAMAVWQVVTEREPTPEELSLTWDSPKLRELEKEWQALQDTYHKTPEQIPGDGGKSKYSNLRRMIERLFQKRLSKHEVRALAARSDALPAYFERASFTSDALEFLVKVLVHSGERDRLVNLLATRCPSWVAWPVRLEYYLAREGKRFEDPIVILGEAYSKCETSETREILANAVRRGFRGLEISGEGDADYVYNAMQWYRQEKEHVVFNEHYGRNHEDALQFMLFKGTSGSARLAISNEKDEMRLPYAIELMFRLKDEESQPVQGARVRLDNPNRVDPREVEMGGDQKWRGRPNSNASGLVQLQTPRNRIPGWLICRDTDRGLIGIKRITSDRPGRVVDVTLQPECRVLGSVHCDALASSPDACWTRIALYSEDHPVMECCGPIGNFHFFVPPGDFTLRIMGRDVQYTKLPLHVTPGQKELRLGEVPVTAQDAASLVDSPAPK